MDLEKEYSLCHHQYQSSNEMKDPFILARTRFYNERLVKARKNYGINSIKLAAKVIGITEVSLGNYERMSGYPKPEIAEKIANFYNKKVEWLFEETYKKIAKAKRNFGKPYLEQSISQAEYISLESKEVKLLEDHSISPVIDKINKDDMHKTVNEALSTLTEKERMVIEQYFGINREYAMTLNEIAEGLGVTKERVRQIKEKAIWMLRHRSRSEGLEIFAGIESTPYKVIDEETEEKIDPHLKNVANVLQELREGKRKRERDARIRCDVCHSHRHKDDISFYIRLTFLDGTSRIKEDRVVVHCKDTGWCREEAIHPDFILLEKKDDLSKINP